MHLIKSTLLCAVIVLSAVASAISQNALQFDGVDDYVSVPHDNALNVSDFTFEAWINLTSTSGKFTILSKGNGAPGNWTNYIFNVGGVTDDGKLGLYAGPGLDWYSGSTTLTAGVWYHVAVTVSGTAVNFYLNGVNDGMATLAGSVSTIESHLFKIGEQGDNCNCNHMNGKIDEVRVWNVARSQSQIKAHMFNRTLSNSAGGLVAYYRFEEGSGTNAGNSGTNTSGIDGTLTGGPSWASSPVQFSGNAISLDGTNDYVSIGAPLSTNSSFTKEAWVYSTAASGNRNILSSSSSPFWISGNQLRAGIPGNFSFVVDPSAFPLNTWTHVAVTFDDATNTMILYKDGNIVNTNNSVTSSYTSENNFIGSHAGASSYFAGNIDEVRIWDVARSQAEIQATMNSELNPAAQANLVAYYTFNQGIADGTNTGLITIIDQKATYNGTVNGFGLSGTLSNYVSQDLGSIALPVSWKYVIAAAQKNGILVKWATGSEQNTRDFTVQHSTDGANWKGIASLAAAGNSIDTKTYSYLHTQPAKGVNYYRILQKDIDDKISYSKIVHENWDSAAKVFTIKNNVITDGSIRIQVDQPGIFSIYDLQGNLTGKYHLSAGEQQISVAGCRKGIYLVKSGKTTERVVIQ